jgi:hypothetical protein
VGVDPGRPMLLGMPTSHDAELQEMTRKTVVNHLAQEVADTLEKTRASDHSADA